ncbi:MAG: hypothetical protein ACRC06_03030, partial [Waterburya sp.]
MVNLNFAVESQISESHANNNIDKQLLNQPHSFDTRHIGVNQQQIDQMLQVLGVDSLDELINQTVPTAIRLNSPLQ